MTSVVIPRISKSVRAEHLEEDSIEIIRVIRPQWIEARDKNGEAIKSKVCVCMKGMQS